jgi:hypothetical protein
VGFCTTNLKPNVTNDNNKFSIITQTGAVTSEILPGQNSVIYLREIRIQIDSIFTSGEIKSVNRVEAWLKTTSNPKINLGSFGTLLGFPKNCIIEKRHNNSSAVELLKFTLSKG